MSCVMLNSMERDCSINIFTFVLTVQLKGCTCILQDDRHPGKGHIRGDGSGGQCGERGRHIQRSRRYPSSWGLQQHMF